MASPRPTARSATSLLPFLSRSSIFAANSGPSPAPREKIWYPLTWCRAFSGLVPIRDSNHECMADCLGEQALILGMLPLDRCGLFAERIGFLRLSLNPQCQRLVRQRFRHAQVGRALDLGEELARLGEQ